MDIFIYDISWEPIFNSCDKCSENVLLSMTCNIPDCINNPSIIHTDTYNILLSGICKSTNDRIVIRDVNFEPWVIVEAKDTVNLKYDKVELIHNGLNFLRKMKLGHIAFCKLYYNSPKEFKQLQHSCKELGIEMYEKDIDIHTLYVTKHDIKIGGWAKVDYSNDNILRDICYINDDTIPPINVMCFDIECQSHNEESFPDPYEESALIVCIGISYKTYEGKYTNYILHCFDKDTRIPETKCIKFKDEFNLIVGFLTLIKTTCPDVVIGYNIFGFDISYIYKRICFMVGVFINMSRLKAKRGFFKTLDWSSSAYSHNKFVIIETFGILFLDVLQYVKREYRFQKYSLDFVSETLLKSNKINLPPKDMFKHITKGTPKSIRIIMKYCIQDVNLTMQLFEHTNMWTGCVEYAKLTGAKIFDLYIRGENKKIIPQLYKQCYGKFIIDESVHAVVSIEGAHVFDPVKGVHDKCAVVDFSSLYPSIIIANNICYSTWDGHRFNRNKMGIIPQMVSTLIDERKKYKTILKTMNANDPLYMIYNKRQNSLKICANSIYGCFGNKSMKILYFPEGASAVTYYGRLYVQMTKTKVEELFPNTTVVYGDTDSCMIKLPQDLELEKSKDFTNIIVNAINKIFPYRVDLALETIFSRAIFVSKKMYAGIEYKTERIVTKGLVSVRTDRCKFVREVVTNVISKILHKELLDSINAYIEEEIILLENNQIDKSKLVLSRTLGELYSSESYPSNVFIQNATRKYATGTKLEYVIVLTKDETNKTLQGLKWRDIQYPYPERLDFEYYKKSLVNSVKSILTLYEDF